MGLANFSTFYGDWFSSCFFDQEETTLYAFLNSPIGVGNSYVDEFSIPDFQFVERKEYSGYNLNWFYRNGEIYGAFYSDYFRCVFIKPID